MLTTPLWRPVTIVNTLPRSHHCHFQFTNLLHAVSKQLCIICWQDQIHECEVPGMSYLDHEYTVLSILLPLFPLFLIFIIIVVLVFLLCYQAADSTWPYKIKSRGEIPKTLHLINIVLDILIQLDPNLCFVVAFEKEKSTLSENLREKLRHCPAIKTNSGTYEFL